MSDRLILASGSQIRAALLRNAGLTFEVDVPRVDEDSVKQSLLAEAASPRDIADTLAELKASRVAARHPGAIVIGCDQVLEHDRGILSKPATPADAIAQITALRGQTHRLLSAVVLYHQGEPVWRHVGTVQLTMHSMSDAWIAAYVVRNWDSIRDAVGAYKLEEEGVRLFSRVDGDYFSVLGLPLLDLLSYLQLRGAISL